ncbi:hypothetical protein [Leucobacter sp. L43]|uniref:hypothetical protein n=1 Tax=Leucobacter sp. L43 TaxID=2798040 RepID=UPI001903F151|nr:hypothetical protein [Leucobacter sp. L43]
MKLRRLGLTAATALILVGALAACAPEPSEEPTEEPAPLASTEPTSDPAPAPTDVTDPVDIVVPSCDVLLPLEKVHQILGDDRPEYVEVGPERLSELSLESFGPAAVSAYESAEQLSHCRWAYPQSDGIIDVVVAELSTEVREKFTSALDDSVFVEGETADGVTYIDEDPQRRKSMPVRFAFIDNVWVATVGSIGPFLDPTIESMLELNPQLRKS